MTEFSIVFVTHTNAKKGADLAHKLVEERLCACVNIIDNIRSIYQWGGQNKDEKEVLLLVKTKKEKVQSVISFVEKNHDYETPECISVPIDKGSAGYLEWLASF